MERRTFLAGAGALAGSVLIGSCGDADDGGRPGGTRAPIAGGNGEWAQVRQQFSLRPDRIHISALLVSSHPEPVRQAIDEYRRRLDEDPVHYLQAENDRRKQAARAAAADYLGGGADHIALTDSTTMGIALVYHGISLRQGDEVITTEHDYYATHESLRLAGERTGATVHQVRLFDDVRNASADEIVSRIASAVTPATRVVALTWVHSSTGLKLPLRQISDAVSDAAQRRGNDDGVLVCVDGVHGFGVEDVVVEDLGCDFFMAGCHKWLFGPRGTGIIWGRPSAWANLTPLIPSFIDDGSWGAWTRQADPPGPTTAARMSPGGFKPFEHQWAMTEAFQFHQDIGKGRIAERTHALARQLKEGLVEMSHVDLLTPMEEELSAGIVCFEVDGLSPQNVVQRLDRQGIVATTTPYAASYPRLTPSIYNTPEEVETVLAELRALAR